MKHKFNNTPSLSWLSKRYSRYANQRVQFQVTEESFYGEWLKGIGEDPTQAIVSAIYDGVCKCGKKGEKLIFGWDYNPKAAIAVFIFRDVVVHIGDKQFWIGKDRRHNKKRNIRFQASDIKIGEFITHQESFKPIQGLPFFDNSTVSL